MENSENKSLAEYMFGKHRVRVIIINGNPWFAAKDVCNILMHTNATRAVSLLDDDEKILLDKSDTTGFDPNKSLGSKKKGGAQSLNFISESGLYNLIFRSTLSEAKRFRKWVTSEVLPAIRRQGFYALEARIAMLEDKMRDEILNREVRIYELKKIADDPKAVEKIDLRRYIMRRMVSTDIHHFEDGEREYYIYANNEEYVCDKEEFIAQVSACFPSAKIKKVRGHWQFWGVGTNLSR
jgi:prophage antirepressor-like protein